MTPLVGSSHNNIPPPALGSAPTACCQGSAGPSRSGSWLASSAKLVICAPGSFSSVTLRPQPCSSSRGWLPGIGAHHAAAAGTQPVVRLQFLLQQGQQAGQITGKAAAAKDQRQVRLAHALEAASHLIDGLLQGGLRGEGRASERIGTTALEPGQHDLGGADWTLQLRRG